LFFEPLLEFGGGHGVRVLGVFVFRRAFRSCAPRALRSFGLIRTRVI
jgi:hypothetical protein